MKQISLASIILLCLFLFGAAFNKTSCQVTCVLQAPVVKIDFGNSTQSPASTFSMPDNYEQVDDYCPQDGNYAVVSLTDNCYGHWISLNEDHTPGDVDGKMLLINASLQPGLFFTAPLQQLMPNTNYEFSTWLINVCMPEYDCTSIRPSLIFIIENKEGKQIARFSTGEVNPTKTTWIRYAAMFKTPDITGTLFLKIVNNIAGGCGNDFAMDDITVRECVMPKPVVKITPKPVPVPVAKKPVVKLPVPVLKPVKNIIPPVEKTAKDSPVIARPMIKERPALSLPRPILTRANPVVKQIETVTSEIVIDLYDNGEIDGDTVSIYHNNELIVSRAGLSAKPVTFRFKVDPLHPHHELVMVANNLGSIPPNTSLMIVTAKDKRYEVFISSSEEKNAKVVIDLKE